ncbi:MAG TPA: PRD domain-containing protein [Clostridiales bacterium]|nr:PRD domain-containing protein [Clostridiales bacterium]
MIVSQILNNHVGIVKRGGNEVIIYSKGLAFCKKAGDKIEDHEIQKMYVLDSHEKLEHFSYLLSNTKEEYFQIVNETIAYGEKIIQEKISDYLYLALLDHINFAIKRLEKDQIIKSPLAWEVKKFYPEHYKIGLYAVDRINQVLQKNCPSEEAVSIALHFINLQTSNGSNVNDMTKMLDTVKDILAIIKYHYSLDLKEDTLNYMRLITHLQYFVVRMIKNEIYDSDETELNKQIRKLYPEAFLCVNKIRKYVETAFGNEISSDEETYLILHIHRVTMYDEKEK